MDPRLAETLRVLERLARGTAAMHLLGVNHGATVPSYTTPTDGKSSDR